MFLCTVSCFPGSDFFLYSFSVYGKDCRVMAGADIRMEIHARFN